MTPSWFKLTNPSDYALLALICYALSGEWRSELIKKSPREIYEHFRRFGAPKRPLVQRIFGWLGTAFAIACAITAFAPLFQ
jgi:hypothetical protein